MRVPQKRRMTSATALKLLRVARMDVEGQLYVEDESLRLFLSTIRNFESGITR